MDDNVIRFPIERRRVSPPSAEVVGTWAGNITMSGAEIPYECTEVIHNFDSVPGRCRCGERYWDPDDPGRIA